MSTFRRLWDLTKKGNGANIFLYIKDVRKAQKKSIATVGFSSSIKGTRHE